MIEKVNPQHPDKIADRIAGALVDFCYRHDDNPKCAFEVLVGHGNCLVIGETSQHISDYVVSDVVARIVGKGIDVKYKEVPQDPELAQNQSEAIRCGDNGIFKGVPIRDEVAELSGIVQHLYEKYPTDGKYILVDKDLTICQSLATTEELKKAVLPEYTTTINPLGDWTGGLDADSGATNRKLGSDMGDAVTGGGLHGKDLSKADVAVNIYAHLKAQDTGKVVELHCAIGDETIDGKPYSEIVKIAEGYIKKLGGFEKLAEWGLV